MFHGSELLCGLSLHGRRRGLGLGDGSGRSSNNLVGTGGEGMLKLLSTLGVFALDASKLGLQSGNELLLLLLQSSNGLDGLDNLTSICEKGHILLPLTLLELGDGRGNTTGRCADGSGQVTNIPSNLLDTLISSAGCRRGLR